MLATCNIEVAFFPVPCTSSSSHFIRSVYLKQTLRTSSSISLCTMTSFISNMSRPTISQVLHAQLAAQSHLTPQARPPFRSTFSSFPDSFGPTVHDPQTSTEEFRPRISLVSVRGTLLPPQQARSGILGTSPSLALDRSFRVDTSPRVPYRLIHTSPCQAPSEVLDPDPDSEPQNMRTSRPYIFFKL